MAPALSIRAPGRHLRLPVLPVNEFPPNVGYGLFGLGWLSLWLLFRPGVATVGDRLLPVGAALRFFGTHSYTVYLHHGFGFWATDYALPYLHVSDRLQGAHYEAWMTVYFVFTLVSTTLIAAGVDGVSALALRALGRRSAPRVGFGVAGLQARDRTKPCSAGCCSADTRFVSQGSSGRRPTERLSAYGPTFG